MREHGAVAELDKGMHNALTVNHDMNLFQREAVKAHGLNDFQALVHERGAVHGDFRAHAPVGMFQGVGGCHGRHFLPSFAVEGAARTGQNQPLDFPHVLRDAEALENGGVFGIHGDNLRAVLLRGLHDEFPRAD